MSLVIILCFFFSFSIQAQAITTIIMAIELMNFLAEAGDACGWEDINRVAYCFLSIFLKDACFNGGRAERECAL